MTETPHGSRRALVLATSAGAWLSVLILCVILYGRVQEARADVEAHVGWLAGAEAMRLTVSSATRNWLQSHATPSDLDAVRGWLPECQLAAPAPVVEATTPETRRAACEAIEIWLERLTGVDDTALSLAQIRVSETLSALVGQVRTQTAGISTRLGRLWTILNVLGISLVAVTGVLGAWFLAYRRRAELLRRAEHRQLAMEILEIERFERERIGADLHDGLAQQLVGISLFQKSLENTLAAQKRPEAEVAGKIGRFISEAINHSRALARGLTTTGRTATGLQPALAGLAADVQILFGIPCEVRTNGTDLQLGREATNHLFRIAQEAVHNAAKHADATRILIELSAMSSEVALRVIDDGVGIPDAAADGDGMGLRLMKHRANLVDGSLSIQSGEQGGTTVACRLRRPPAGDIAGFEDSSG